MPLPHTLAALLVLSLSGSVALAQQGENASPDEEVDKVVPAEVKEVVEARAKEEDTDGEPVDSNIGEASYNVSNCAPGEGSGGSAESAPESDPDAIDDCENIDE